MVTPSTTPILLASSSTFRQSALQKFQLPFDCASPNIDESKRPHESPHHYVQRMAQEKARALQSQYPQHLIIGSDQTAFLGEYQLHKPGNRETAIRQLQQASGKRIQFLTSLCVLQPNPKAPNHTVYEHLDTTEVQFKTLSNNLIHWYLDAEAPYQCAGSFKSEGLGILLFESIQNQDPSALIGLPLIALGKILQQTGHLPG